MTFKPVYESAEEVPEPLKEYFTEKDGKYSFVGLEGYKPTSEFDAVHKSLLAERKEKKALKEIHSPWETAFAGKTPTEIQAELERIPILEADATGKVDKSKISEMVEVAAKNRVVPVERERDGYKTQVAELQAIIHAHDLANRRRTIFDAVREVAAKENVFHETTYSSTNGALMLLAEKYLTIDETTGNVVVSDEATGIAAGLGVKDALAELGNQHPYLRKVSIGGGANGSAGVPGGGTNPFRNNNLTERGKFMSAYPDKWQALMKAAGLDKPDQMHKSK